jgi:hypothetical protein
MTTEERMFSALYAFASITVVTFAVSVAGLLLVSFA